MIGTCRHPGCGGKTFIAQGEYSSGSEAEPIILRQRDAQGRERIFAFTQVMRQAATGASKEVLKQSADAIDPTGKLSTYLATNHWSIVAFITALLALIQSHIQDVGNSDSAQQIQDGLQQVVAEIQAGRLEQSVALHAVEQAVAALPDAIANSQTSRPPSQSLDPSETRVYESSEERMSKRRQRRERGKERAKRSH